VDDLVVGTWTSACRDRLRSRRRRAGIRPDGNRRSSSRRRPLPGCFNDSNQPCNAGSALSGGAASLADPGTVTQTSSRAARDRRSTHPPLGGEQYPRCLTACKSRTVSGIAAAETRACGNSLDARIVPAYRLSRSGGRLDLQGRATILTATTGLAFKEINPSKSRRPLTAIVGMRNNPGVEAVPHARVRLPRCRKRSAICRR